LGRSWFLQAAPPQNCFNTCPQHHVEVLNILEMALTLYLGMPRRKERQLFRQQTEAAAMATWMHR
jgi:hypothetical protein